MRKSACSSVGARPGVRAREDRRGGLAQELVEREPRVLASCQLVRARLDERAHERPVLVERRAAERWRCSSNANGSSSPSSSARPRKTNAPRQKLAESDVQLRSADRHGSAYAAGGASSCLAAWAPVGGAVGVALAARATIVAAAPARPPGAAVDASARPRRGERRLHQPRAPRDTAARERLVVDVAHA